MPLFVTAMGFRDNSACLLRILRICLHWGALSTRQSVGRVATFMDFFNGCNFVNGVLFLPNACFITANDFTLRLFSVDFDFHGT